MPRGLALATCILLLFTTGSAGGAARRPLVPTAIAFWDERNGFATFTRPERCEGKTCNAIGRTTDGGRTWKLSPTGTAWIDPVAVPGGGAWAREQPEYRLDCTPPPLRACRQVEPAVFRSHNGGRTWQLAISKWQKLRVASFPTPSHGWAFSGSRLLRSTDGGRTWHERPTPCDPSWAAYVAFVTPARGWILCARQPDNIRHPQALFTTRDGGSRWTLVMDAGYRHAGQSSPGAICGCGWPGGVSFARGGRGLIWQSGDLTYTTSDGGRTWSDVRFTTTWSVNGLSGAQISARTAYLLVHESVERRWDLRRTDDYGRSWRVVHVWQTR